MNRICRQILRSNYMSHQDNLHELPRRRKWTSGQVDKETARAHSEQERPGLARQSACLTLIAGSPNEAKTTTTTAMPKLNNWHQQRFNDHRARAIPAPAAPLMVMVATTDCGPVSDVTAMHAHSTNLRGITFKPGRTNAFTLDIALSFVEVSWVIEMCTNNRSLHASPF